MKNALIPLAKSVFDTTWINNSNFSNKYSYSTENFWIENDCTDNLKQRNGRYCEYS